MLLIDIGNSTTVIASYTKGQIEEKCRLNTALFAETFDAKEFKNKEEIWVSSVVPWVDPLFKSLPQTRMVDYRTIPLLKLAIKKPEQVGADRLVNALAAYMLYKTDLLVIDLGTALTFCYVSADAHYQGGAIFPGTTIASKALSHYTAKIPLILLKSSQKKIGKTTKEAVQVGLYRGYIYLINGFIQDWKAAYPQGVVMGTGQGLDLLKEHLYLDHYDPQLILKGLAFCAEKNYEISY